MINTQWLKDFLNPAIEVVENKKIPNTLVEYIGYYIEYRKNELNDTSIKKFNVIKQKMKRFQIYRKKPILINEINDSFKNELVSYYKKEGYAQNTMQRELVLIKTFCKHARYLGLDTHSQLDSLKLERAKVEKIYLSFNDIQAIENIEQKKLTESLQNARDWLIISCYTGQRVSDFLRFNKDMIRIENKRVAVFSYLSFITIMVVLSRLNLFTNAPIKHYYMPLLGLFFDFNLYDVFIMNFVVIFFVTLIFYFFVYKLIIKRVSTKKMDNIDTIQAIRDGDNL